MTDGFRRGDIVGYPYLWSWQDAQGREHGEKDRPVCLLLTMADANDNTHLILLPISSKPPFEGQTGIEIPTLELRRANLAGYEQGRITVSEYNTTFLSALIISMQAHRHRAGLAKHFSRQFDKPSCRIWPLGTPA